MEQQLKTVKDLMDYLNDNNKNNLDWKINGHLLFVMPDTTQKESIPMLSMSGNTVSIVAGLCELTTQVFNILKKQTDPKIAKQTADFFISRIKLSIGLDDEENTNAN